MEKPIDVPAATLEVTGSRTTVSRERQFLPTTGAVVRRSSGGTFARARVQLPQDRTGLYQLHHEGLHGGC